MINLQLVRFGFTPVCTYGIMYARDGWSCFTGERGILSVSHPKPDTAGVNEGLFRLRMLEVEPAIYRIGLFEDDGHKPACLIQAHSKAVYTNGNITVGMQMNLETGAFDETDTAELHLRALVKLDEQVFLTIRHLDQTQLAHFERMRAAANK